MLGIAIVNYNSAAKVRALAESLARSNLAGQGHLVLAVDNSDEQFELSCALSPLRDRGFDVQVVRPGRNLGYAKGNNLAAAQLLDRGARVLWVLNPDTLVVRGAFPSGMAEGSDPSPWIAATDLVGKDGAALEGLASFDVATSQSRPRAAGPSRRYHDYVAGHSLMVSAAAWRRLGGFDERFFLYCEEIDLCERAREQGVPILSLSGVRVLHEGGFSTGSSDGTSGKSEVTFLHGTRSRVLLYKKHWPLLLPWIILLRASYALTVALRGNARGGRAIVTGIVQGLSGQGQWLP